MDRDLLQEARRLGTATLHEASGQRGALPSAINPISSAMRLAGPAFTVATPPGNNLWIHRALAAAAPGDVLVVATSGEVSSIDTPSSAGAGRCAPGKTACSSTR